MASVVRVLYSPRPERKSYSRYSLLVSGSLAFLIFSGIRFFFFFFFFFTSHGSRVMLRETENQEEIILDNSENHTGKIG